MKLQQRIRRFSPTLPHYLFGGIFLLRVISLARLSQSALLLPARGDMHFYNEWAQRILRGEAGVHGAFYGLPLYAYFLAFLYRLFGSSPFLPGLLQALIDSGTAIVIYQLILLLLRNRLKTTGTLASGSATATSTEAKVFASLGAVSWALFVPAQAYSIILMPTAWFVFVFWLVVWRIASNDQTPGSGLCLTLGLLIGFTSMAIATGLFLIPLVLAALVLKRGSRDLRVVALRASLFLAGIGIGTSPCWIHNYFIARDPVFLSAHGGVNFWIGNNPIANGYPRFPPGLRAGQVAMLEDSITSAESAVGHPLKRSEVSAYWSRKAWAYVASNPGRWMHLLLIKARNFWNAFQYDDLSIITNLREQGIIFPGVYFGLIAALGLAGGVVAVWSAPVSRWIIAAILLQMVALMTVFITERYRMVVVPGLTSLAAFGLWMFWRCLRDANYLRGLAFAGALSIAAIFVSWPQKDPSLWALDAYNSGWQALESGDLQLAETKLNLALRYVPSNPETNFALGNLRLAEGKTPAAAAFYLATLQYDNNHRGALNNLAVIALNQKRYDAAEDWLRRAERIDPRNAKTHYLLASALWRSGNHDAAATEIETAIQLQPRQAEFTKLKDEISPNRP